MINVRGICLCQALLCAKSKKISRPLFVRLFFNAIVRFHFSSKGGEQDIQLTYDKRIVSHYSDPKSTGKVADPGT